MGGHFPKPVIDIVRMVAVEAVHKSQGKPHFEKNGDRRKILYRRGLFVINLCVEVFDQENVSRRKQFWAEQNFFGLAFYIPLKGYFCDRYACTLLFP